MNIEQFKARFENEHACRSFIESVLWKNGRFIPQCQCDKSYRLSGESVRACLYECARCKRQFIVTSHTPSVFNYLSKKHFKQYLQEIEFRWNHRIPKMKRTRNGNL